MTRAGKNVIHPRWPVVLVCSADQTTLTHVAPTPLDIMNWSDGLAPDARKNLHAIDANGTRWTVAEATDDDGTPGILLQPWTPHDPASRTKRTSRKRTDA